MEPTQASSDEGGDEYERVQYQVSLDGTWEVEQCHDKLFDDNLRFPFAVVGNILLQHLLLFALLTLQVYVAAFACPSVILMPLLLLGHVLHLLW